MAKKSTKKFTFSDVGGILDDLAKKIPIQVIKEDTNIPPISTGVYILNAAMSSSLKGGVLADAITVFAGPESSGKTFLALNIARQAQKMGYHIIYIDTERALRLRDFSGYGVDNSREGLTLLNANKVEELNMSLTQLIDKMKETKLAGGETGKFMIVIDSLGQLASNKEKEDLIAGKNKQDMTKAKALGAMFRSITVDLAYLEIPLIINNQTYSTMDMYPQEVMKGGKSLYYSASNIIFLGKAKLKTGEEEDSDLGQSGIVVTAKCIKNRQAKPKKVKFEISFNDGCNPYVGLDMFCVGRFFDRIGIAKGKYDKYDVPVEVVDTKTGEIFLKEGELKEGGNRWYIRHLDKYVYTKKLFTSSIFTPDVLEAIEPIAHAYFKYKSMEEIEEYNTIEEEDTDDEFLDKNIEDVSIDDL